MIEYSRSGKYLLKTQSKQPVLPVREYLVCAMKSLDDNLPSRNIVSADDIGKLVRGHRKAQSST